MAGLFSGVTRKKLGDGGEALGESGGGPGNGGQGLAHRGDGAFLPGQQHIKDARIGPCVEPDVAAGLLGLTFCHGGSREVDGAQVKALSLPA